MIKKGGNKQRRNKGKEWALYCSVQHERRAYKTAYDKWREDEEGEEEEEGEKKEEEIR